MFNTSLNNDLNFANKTEITDWGIPDFSAGVSASSLPYTAPSIGVLYYIAASNNMVQLKITGKDDSGFLSTTRGYSNNTISGVVYLSKGDEVALKTGSYGNGIFYPLKGA